jgi:hypothetical protein
MMLKHYEDCDLVMREKPKAYRSPLWKHLEEIRRWRRNQETWEAIAERLRVEFGIRISFQSVQSFFKRATDPEHKQPLGFEPETQKMTPTQRLEPADPSPVEEPVDPFSVETSSNPIDPFAKSRRKYQQQNPNE